MKKRLDLLLVEREIFSSRTRAQVHILSGEVFVNHQKELVSSKLIDVNSSIDVKLLKDNFVSRGGLKLEKALEVFNLTIENSTCLDIGASTGGFTDCLLRKKAEKVFSVDVGYGQLDFKLRNNPKVINLEKTNARYLTRVMIEDDIDLIVMDVSFISITKFDNFFSEFTSKRNAFIGLIKPQFELSRDKIGKNGIVREDKYRKEAVSKVTKFLQGFYSNVKAPIESPIKGAKGNTEYLIFCQN